MSNLTSVSGEASGSSGNMGDENIRHQPVGAPQQLSMAAVASGNGNNTTGQAPVKRKRNLPGTPDPDAEVVALSPRTLMATNRFICEICNKGFQRDQNLQLHRRGHNLPWKLRQRTSTEIKKRVYICPEPSCVHHDPTRALGDLTGIKKHFCRKHGEKKWKCDKCSKRYAVQSDWKAHSKTCGTREYRCDCGTLFSRRDSFITHRAFCDALAEDGSRAQEGINQQLQGMGAPMSSSPPPGKPNMPISSMQMNMNRTRLSSSPWEPPSHESGAIRPGLPLLLGQDRKDIVSQMQQFQGNPNHLDAVSSGFFPPKGMSGLMGLSEHESQMGQKSSLFPMAMTNTNPGPMFSGLYGSRFRPMEFEGDLGSLNHHEAGNRPSNHSAHMSATALLQKAAQMGATTSTSPLLPTFGMAGPNMSSSTTQSLQPSWQDPSQHDQRLVDQFNSFNDNHGSSNSLGSQYFTRNQQKSSENTTLHDSLMQNQMHGGMYMNESNVQVGSFGGQSIVDSIPHLGTSGFDRENNNMGGPSQLQGRLGFPMSGKHRDSGDFSIGGKHRDGGDFPMGGKHRDGGDKLTRDFLGVGPTPRVVGRPLSERDLVNVRSQMESGGIELEAYANNNNKTDNHHSHGQSTQKSWEVS